MEIKTPLATSIGQPLVIGMNRNFLKPSSSSERQEKECAVTKKAKTLGNCPACDTHGSLTMQHVRLVPELKGYKILLCERCHTIVTRYEDEIFRALEHVKGMK